MPDAYLFHRCSCVLCGLAVRIFCVQAPRRGKKGPSTTLCEGAGGELGLLNLGCLPLLGEAKLHGCSLIGTAERAALHHDATTAAGAGWHGGSGRFVLAAGKRHWAICQQAQRHARLLSLGSTVPAGTGCPSGVVRAPLSCCANDVVAPTVAAGPTAACALLGSILKSVGVAPLGKSTFTSLFTNSAM